MMTLDINIRTAAMNHLNKLKSVYGDIIPHSELRKGFQYFSETIHLISQQGIFKPSQLDLPLTISSTFNGPYNDDIGDEYISYKYRGNDPSFVDHRDNTGLRNVMNSSLPLIYFHGVEIGRYVPIYPVFIVNDNPKKMTFTLAADDIKVVLSSTVEDESSQQGRRKYVTREVKTRLHQSSFRAIIMKAYKDQCSICRLKHPRLLDAAHIIPDSEPTSSSNIDNGLSLCKIHHSAFDQSIIGITPDYIIKVRTDILEEIDGPMLKHGIQEMHNKSLFTPSSKNKKPSKNSLDWRYQRFLSA
ncbi:MAG: HNH endonuclease [Balneola sp.]